MRGFPFSEGRYGLGEWKRIRTQDPVPSLLYGLEPVDCILMGESRREERQNCGCIGVCSVHRQTVLFLLWVCLCVRACARCVCWCVASITSVSSLL